MNINTESNISHLSPERFRPAEHIHVVWGVGELFLGLPRWRSQSLMLSAALSGLTAGFPVVPRSPSGSLTFCVRTSTRTGASETCFARSSFLTKAVTIISWLKGLRRQLECGVDVPRLGMGKELATRAADQWRKPDISYYGLSSVLFRMRPSHSTQRRSIDSPKQTAPR